MAVTCVKLIKCLGTPPWHKRNYKTYQFCERISFQQVLEIKFIPGLWFNSKGLSLLLRVKNEFPCLALQFTAHPPSICSSRRWIFLLPLTHHSRGESLTHLSARGTFSRRRAANSISRALQRQKSIEGIYSEQRRPRIPAAQKARERKKTERDEGFVLLTFLILSLCKERRHQSPRLDSFFSPSITFLGAVCFVFISSRCSPLKIKFFLCAPEKLGRLPPSKQVVCVCVLLDNHLNI